MAGIHVMTKGTAGLTEWLHHPCRSLPGVQGKGDSEHTKEQNRRHSTKTLGFWAENRKNKGKKHKHKTAGIRVWSPMPVLS